MKILLLTLLVACGRSGGGDCGNVIDVGCHEGDPADCFCAAGPDEGKACTLEEGRESDADYCDTVCVYCEVEDRAGPPSVLLGTK